SRRDDHAPAAVLHRCRDRPSLPAEGEDELNEPHREGDVKDRHQDLVGNMPIELGELVQTVDKIQQQENDAEQHDAAADEAMPQIAEQHDRRLSARYMRAGRYDQRLDDHLLDVRKYLPGDRLDMFGIE